MHSRPFSKDDIGEVNSRIAEFNIIEEIVGDAVDRVRNPLDAIFIFRIHFANRMRFVRLALVNHVRVNQVQGALSLAGLH